jgi:hypothetical protein
MKAILKYLFFVVGVFPFFSIVNAQQLRIEHLESYEKQKIKANSDWLINDIDQKAGIYRTPEGYMVFSNGLISRTFELNTNGATIALDNLITNESLVRAVSPEAVIWVNGQEINVGGLTGQPVANYLLPEWINQLKAAPYSLKLHAYNLSPIKERMEWNRRTTWTAQHLPWPPKGKELTFTYKASAEVIANYAKLKNADSRRKLLYQDDFNKISDAWKIFTGNLPLNSFNNEGKAGEVLAPGNALVFAEQELPEGAKVIICKLNSGTDAGTEFGPGMALQFPDATSVGFTLSAADKRFLIHHNGKQQGFTGFDPSKSYYLRVEMTGNKMLYSVSEDNKNYKALTEQTVKQAPQLIRIGKINPGGKVSTKAASSGKLSRFKIEQVLVLGSPEKNSDTDFLADLVVKVHYELYDGIPLLSKWVSVENKGKEQIIVNNIKSEHLAVTEAESAVEYKQRWELPPIFAESDFAFGSMSPNAAENACIGWQRDSTYTTQVNYNLNTPSVLVCMPKTGMGQELLPGQSFESMRLWELLYDSYDRERRGLSERKLYRTIAPWVTENPIIMHVSSAEDEQVKKAIDQCAEVGFEMVIMTFGSGFNIEDTSSVNLMRMKKLRDYAQRKGIGLGGYSLLASRSIDKQNDVIMANGFKPAFGNSPCLESEWGNAYFDRLYNFYKTTGFDLLEHDGSYPGDICASENHPGHRGFEDSRWKQFKKIQDLYKWSRGKGVYLNVPDWYFLNGSNKVAMGYRETNWSLPRELQEIIERQNIYDGTWQKTPSMGWMFVPLVEYHGGGAAATIEPLKAHLPHYEQRLANLFGAGVQACYRGPQLYDAPETKALVEKWVDFYKKHRRILDADIVHLRRPDGRDYDAILHVDPKGEEKGLLMIYNPLNESISREINVDLYYTGLKDNALLSEDGKAGKQVKLNGSELTIKVIIPAKSQKYIVLK